MTQREDDGPSRESLLRETTELRAELERARERASQLEAIFYGALDAILISDDAGRYVDANPAALTLFGVSREELLGKTAADFSEIADFDAVWKAFLAAGRADGRYELIRPDGERRTLEFVSVTHVSPGRHLSVLRDLSARKRLEEQIGQEHRLQSLGRLASGIVHDFDEMLASVLSFADFVEEELPANHPKRGELAEIVLVVGRAYELVRQLLAFGRHQALEPAPFGVGDLVADVARLTHLTLPNDVELVLVPGSGEVLADRSQIFEVVMNLVLNARDALRAGGTITVETTVIHLLQGELLRKEGLSPGNYALITVSDDGIGMDPEVRQRVFEPFFSTKKRGEGMGLAAAYGIIKQSGGHIEVESELGKGTTVRVYLPALRETTPPAEPT